MHARGWTYLKWSCLGIAIGSVLLAVWMMWQHGRQTTTIATLATTPAGKGGTEVEQPWMVERKGERVLWRLKAKEAKQGIDTMHLTEPYLELFNDAGEKITITSEQGDIEILTRNVHFQGSVRAHYQSWLLTSDDLRYESRTDDVVVPHDFIAKRPHTSVQGRGLRVNRETRIVHIQHAVHIQDDSPDSQGVLP